MVPRLAGVGTALEVERKPTGTLAVKESAPNLAPVEYPLCYRSWSVEVVTWVMAFVA